MDIPTSRPPPPVSLAPPQAHRTISMANTSGQTRPSTHSTHGPHGHVSELPGHRGPGPGGCPEKPGSSGSSPCHSPGQLADTVTQNVVAAPTMVLAV